MREDLKGKLVGILGADNVKENESMSSVTTFRVGGPADFLCTPETEEQILALTAFLREAGEPYFVLGSGSNLLVRDGGIRGVVLRLGGEFSRVTVKKTQDGALLTAQAGAKLSAVGHEAAAQGLTGFEFACGIPGSVGGAVRMNAGAYGGEMKDILPARRKICSFPTGTVFWTKTEGWCFPPCFSSGKAIRSRSRSGCGSSHRREERNSRSNIQAPGRPSRDRKGILPGNLLWTQG